MLYVRRVGLQKVKKKTIWSLTYPKTKTTTVRARIDFILVYLRVQQMALRTVVEAKCCGNKMCPEKGQMFSISEQ